MHGWHSVCVCVCAFHLFAVSYHPLIEPTAPWKVCRFSDSARSEHFLPVRTCTVRQYVPFSNHLTGK